LVLKNLGGKGKKKEKKICAWFLKSHKEKKNTHENFVEKLLNTTN